MVGSQRVEISVLGECEVRRSDRTRRNGDTVPSHRLVHDVYPQVPTGQYRWNPGPEEENTPPSVRRSLRTRGRTVIREVPPVLTVRTLTSYLRSLQRTRFSYPPTLSERRVGPPGFPGNKDSRGTKAPRDVKDSLKEPKSGDGAEFKRRTKTMYVGTPPRVGRRGSRYSRSGAGRGFWCHRTGPPTL